MAGAAGGARGSAGGGVRGKGAGQAETVGQKARVRRVGVPRAGEADRLVGLRLVRAGRAGRAGGGVGAVRAGGAEVRRRGR